MAITALIVGQASDPDSGLDYVLSPDVALVVTDSGSGFILDMANRFYAISRVTTAMLQATLLSGEAPAAEAVAAEFGADLVTVRADLRTFLDDLVVRKVIRLRGRHNGTAPPIALGALLIARLARFGFAVLPAAGPRSAVALMLCRISFALFGWISTLAAWKRYIRPGAAIPNQPDAVLCVIDESVRRISAQLPFGGNCKERALSAWALARAAGVPAALVVGVVQYPFEAHTWCEAATSTILGDEARHCERYVPVFRYE